MSQTPAIQELLRNAAEKFAKWEHLPPETEFELEDGTIITLDEVNEHFIDRAFVAYARSGALQQPSCHLSGVCEYRNRQYVRLANVNGVLAVYRIHGRFDEGGRPYRRIRRMKAWPRRMPKALFTAPAPTSIY